MFGLGLPAGSFPLRSQQECQECCMRRKRKEWRRGGETGEDDGKERNAKKDEEEEEGGGKQGIQSEMKIEGGRREDEGQEKYETLRKRLIIFRGLSKHKNKEDENNKAGKYLGGTT